MNIAEKRRPQDGRLKTKTPHVSIVKVGKALHAKTLGFKHPSTDEDLFFESDIPSDMQEVIEKWRGYAETSKY